MKRHIDQFDLEAEAEGKAVSEARKNQINRPSSKKSRRNRDKIERANTKHQNKVVKRYMK